MVENPAPSMWSLENPKLQIAWDATSLSLLMKCPRLYQYAQIEGWRGSGVDVEFGGYFASSVETYKKERLNGKTKEEATLAAIQFVLNATWLGDKPWGGEYLTQWHCTGSLPYKNKRGNRAKCPWGFKGKWYLGEGASVCGECGSPTETARRWVPGDRVKDRYGLLRLVSWYCDEQAESLTEGGGLKPYAFPNGTPAVELSFKLPTPWRTGGGETYILAGHMDSLATFGSEVFITDNKTTGKPLNAMYFSQYSPNVQVDLYDLAGSILFPALHISGVAIEAAQILKGGAKFAVQPFYRSEPLREEFMVEIEWWLKQAEKYATDNFWPMNRASCFLCNFKEICSKEPGKRQQYLESNFKKRVWNPLDER